MVRHDGCLEGVITAASSIKDSLEKLMQAFAKMPHTIEKEHRAIKAGNLTEIESCCAEKTLVGEQIDAAFGSLTSAGQKLAHFHASLCGGGKRGLTLKETVVQLDEVYEALSQEGLAHGVLGHLKAGIKALAEEFTQSAQKAQPLIEMNRYLVKTLLQNHQESFRFWQEISQEVQAPYNQQGQQRAKSTHSVLRTKA